MKDIRNHFPIFQKHPSLVYLDSGATALKPQAVITAETDYYATYSANIHRGLYPLSIQATEAVESARDCVKGFIGATHSEEIVFTKGTTEGINLVCEGHERSAQFASGDEVVVTILDHHSNFVPWQQAATRCNMRFTVLQNEPVETWHEKISSRTKVLSIPYVSNVTGEILPVRDIISRVRRVNPDIVIVVDAAQAAAYIPLDVHRLDCDFLVFSAHKAYGPTGVGVLYGKRERLEKLAPYQFGGDMIHSVSIEKATWNILPYRFEAGTPAIAQIIALAESLKFIQSISPETIVSHAREISDYARSRFDEEFGERLRIISPVFAQETIGTLSFTLHGVHPHDIADSLGSESICIRAGHHCAQPLHTHLGQDSSCRLSFGIYNTKRDIETLISSLVSIASRFEV